MHFRTIQWFVLLTILAYLGVVWFQGSLITSELVQVYVGELVFLVLGAWFLTRQKRSISDYTKLELPVWWSFLVVVPVILSTIFLSSFVTALSMLVTRSFQLIDIPNPDLTQITSSNLMLVLSFALLPGIVEEFFCRGVLLQGYQETISTKAAIFWSSLVFGLLHFNLWNILSPMVLGVVLALLTLRFDSIIPAMFGHALFNLLVLGLEKIRLTADFVDSSEAINWSELLNMAPVALVSLVFLGVIFTKLGVWQRFKPAQMRLRPGDHLPSAILIGLFLAMNFLIQKGLGL